MKKYHLVKNGESVETFSMLDDEDLSDGYHTFGELYAHRLALTAVLAACVADDSAKAGVPSAAWKSKAHHPDDAPIFEGGYFIVGIELDTGTITYHYKLKHWDDFAAVPELPHAKKWDGATPDDTVTRLLAVARDWTISRPTATVDASTLAAPLMLRDGARPVTAVSACGCESNGSVLVNPCAQHKSAVPSRVSTICPGVPHRGHTISGTPCPLWKS